MLFWVLCGRHEHVRMCVCVCAAHSRRACQGVPPAYTEADGVHRRQQEAGGNLGKREGLGLTSLLCCATGVRSCLGERRGRQETEGAEAWLRGDPSAGGAGRPWTPRSLSAVTAALHRPAAAAALALGPGEWRCRGGGDGHEVQAPGSGRRRGSDPRSTGGPRWPGRVTPHAACLQRELRRPRGGRHAAGPGCAGRSVCTAPHVGGRGPRSPGSPAQAQASAELLLRNAALYSG